MLSALTRVPGVRHPPLKVMSLPWLSFDTHSHLIGVHEAGPDRRPRRRTATHRNRLPVRRADRITSAASPSSNLRFESDEPKPTSPAVRPESAPPAGPVVRPEYVAANCSTTRRMSSAAATGQVARGPRPPERPQPPSSWPPSVNVNVVASVGNWNQRHPFDLREGSANMPNAPRLSRRV